MDLTLTVLGDFVARAGAEMPPRVREDWEVVYFPTATSTHYQTTSGIWVLTRPSLVLTPPGEQHSYTFDCRQATRHLFAHFHWYPEAAVLGGAMPSVIPASQIAISGPAFQQAMHLASSHEPLWRERATAWISALVLEMVGLSATEPSERRDRLPQGVAHALAFIDEHLHESIRVSDVAHRVGWSREYLSRMFLVWVGKSPTQAILEARVDRACVLLQDTPHSIREIAHAVGFQDEYYFSRIFPKVKGMTPSAYRRTYSGDLHVSQTEPQDYSLSSYPLNRYFVFPL